MNIKAFKAALPKVEKLFSISLFFENVKEDFKEYSHRGFYQFLETEQLFIYEYKDEERSYTGMICTTDIQDYLNNTIVKHEDTLIEKEEKQIKLALERSALIKPVLLTYPNASNIQSVLLNYKESNQPIYSTFYKRGQHTFWGISDRKIIDELIELFKTEIPKAYIADGHHRSAATAALYQKTKSEQYRQMMTIYLSDTEMKVSNWNRVITGIENYTELGLMAMLSNCFNMTPLVEPFQPEEPRTLVMLMKKQWFKLTWKEEILNKYENLPLEQQFDISIFNEEVANKLLGITNVRSDKRLDHLDSRKGFEGIKKAVQRGEGTSIGFIFSPLKLSDLFDVANRDKIMPPKSTFMLPRMQNGMLVYPYDKN